MSEVATDSVLEFVNTKLQNPKRDQDRKIYNAKLVQILQSILNSYPTLRFSQALYNYGFVKDSDIVEEKTWQDEYYTEPKEIFERVEKTIIEVNK